MPRLRRPALAESVDQVVVRLFVALALLILPGFALGKTFACSAPEAAVYALFSKEAPEVLVTATISEDGKTGTIEVADRIFKAEYGIQGLDRTWSFRTDEDQKYGYLFLIQPDGKAGYFDFELSNGEPTEPRQAYLCSEI